MKRLILPTLLAAVAAAAPAAAQPAPQVSSAAPVAASGDDFRLVIKDVTVLDSAGAAVAQHHCEWREPADDDKPCLAFSGDPKAAYDAIRDAGGASATVATDVPDLELETLTRISQRADGTWLFRTEGTERGDRFYSGWVCSADGRTCSRYEAATRSRAKRAIKAATSRVKQRDKRRRGR